jgi:hypothetical protein
VGAKLAVANGRPVERRSGRERKRVRGDVAPRSSARASPPPARPGCDLGHPRAEPGRAGGATTTRGRAGTSRRFAAGAARAETSSGVEDGTGSPGEGPPRWSGHGEGAEPGRGAGTGPDGRTELSRERSEHGRSGGGASRWGLRALFAAEPTGSLLREISPPASHRAEPWSDRWDTCREVRSSDRSTGSSRGEQGPNPRDASG